jgi:hypothetical protein
MIPRTSGPRVAVLAALWVAVVGAIATASGCYGRVCEPSFGTWGLEPGEGRMLDPDTWESNPLDGQWLDFPGQRTWVLEMRGLGGRIPEKTAIPYISASGFPAATGSNFTVASGNLAELTFAGPGRLVVRNGVCSDYFLRVVVEAAPNPPDPTPAPVTPSDPQPDAGLEPDAGP